ncbi:hypothetical protein Hanom_Chr09g00834781 [Helianthus anomalus]
MIIQSNSSLSIKYARPVTSSFQFLFFFILYMKQMNGRTIVKKNLACCLPQSRWKQDPHQCNPRSPSIFLQIPPCNPTPIKIIRTINNNIHVSR